VSENWKWLVVVTLIVAVETLVMAIVIADRVIDHARRIDRLECRVTAVMQAKNLEPCEAK